MKYNILLIIVDCLRYDRVTPRHMPFLHEFGQQNTWFSNFWSVSHCTDPSISALLTGKWPDELRLYSMMWDTDWNLPTEVPMLAEMAKENGYSTAMVSNLVRWYQRGQDTYIDNRGWYGADSYAKAVELIRSMDAPWFVTVHDDSCHANYRGGGYDVACKEVDSDLMATVAAVFDDKVLKESTFIIITSDHGEGLGDHNIAQHGFGLWPELTHVPLVIRYPIAPPIEILRGEPNHAIYQHIDLFFYMLDVVGGPPYIPAVKPRSHAHMVGRTPNWWHRGVTDGEALVIKQQEAKRPDLPPVFTKIDLRTGTETIFHIAGNGHELWNAARSHAAQFGLDADDDTLADDDVLEQRLRALGYFE